VIKKELDPFKAKLAAAYCAPDLSCADACKLSAVKAAWSRTGIGLTKEEERWLTRLARKGGWTSKPEDNTFTYIEDDE